MAETQVGVAKIYGLTGAQIGLGAATIETADLEHKFKLDESLDQSGQAETLFATNQVDEVSISYAPHSGGVTIPAPLATVVLSGFAVSRYNQSYRYVGGGTIKMVRDKECSAGLKLRRYLGSAGLQ